jgi:hypothetical protein
LRLHFLQEEESYFTLAEDDDVKNDESRRSQTHPDITSAAMTRCPNPSDAAGR